jgi:hypothetical protein
MKGRFNSELENVSKSKAQRGGGTQERHEGKSKTQQDKTAGENLNKDK